MHNLCNRNSAEYKTNKETSVRSLVTQRPPASPLLYDLPKTLAPHCSDPITVNRSQTNTKNTALWENASSPHFDYCLWIRRKLICHEDNLLATQHFLFSYSALCCPRVVALLWLVFVCVCVLDLLRKKKEDLLGLESCNRLIAVGNLSWHHQIHDQPLI